MNKATQGLITARALLKKPEDWTTQVRDNGRGGHCAMGLLDLAFGYDPNIVDYTHLRSKEYQEAVAALAAAVPDPHEYYDNSTTMNVVHHNNNSDFETVCRWFDRVIAMRMLLEPQTEPTGAEHESADGKQ